MHDGGEASAGNGSETAIPCTASLLFPDDGKRGSFGPDHRS